jgi:hypothetical protein
MHTYSICQIEIVPCGLVRHQNGVNVRHEQYWASYQNTRHRTTLRHIPACICSRRSGTFREATQHTPVRSLAVLVEPDTVWLDLRGSHRCCDIMLHVSLQYTCTCEC